MTSHHHPWICWGATRSSRWGSHWSTLECHAVTRFRGRRHRRAWARGSADSAHGVGTPAQRVDVVLRQLTASFSVSFSPNENRLSKHFTNGLLHQEHREIKRRRAKVMTVSWGIAYVRRDRRARPVTVGSKDKGDVGREWQHGASARPDVNN
jgi:hypothetical protein